METVLESSLLRGLTGKGVGWGGLMVVKLRKHDARPCRLDLKEKLDVTTLTLRLERAARYQPEVANLWFLVSVIKLTRPHTHTCAVVARLPDRSKTLWWLFVGSLFNLCGLIKGFVRDVNRCDHDILVRSSVTVLAWISISYMTARIVVTSLGRRPKSSKKINWVI